MSCTLSSQILSLLKSSLEIENNSVVSSSLQPHGLYSPWNSPGKNTGVGSCSLLQGIFLIQELNPGFLHRTQNLYHLSHQGSPRTEPKVIRKGRWAMQWGHFCLHCHLQHGSPRSLGILNANQNFQIFMQDKIDFIFSDMQMTPPLWQKVKRN